MKTYVVYFTRSNNSKRIAEKIANKLNAELVQITDGHSYKGLFGYIKAGFYSTSNKKVNIVTDKEINNYDKLIVVSPIWAGKLANPIRTFLEDYDLKNIHLVTSSIGSVIKDTSFYKSVSPIIKNESNEEFVISKIEEIIK
jgi:flavodoxin